MQILVPGHKYELNNLVSGTQSLTFRRSSSGAIKYESDWDGLLSQEVLRVLINRTQFLNDVLPASETEHALECLRKALYWYEARAWRRKQQSVNRTGVRHGESEVPFSTFGIEHRGIGEDGHVLA